jgi:hypothetical protein
MSADWSPCTPAFKGSNLGCSANCLREPIVMFANMPAVSGTQRTAVLPMLIDCGSNLNCLAGLETSRLLALLKLQCTIVLEQACDMLGKGKL